MSKEVWFNHRQVGHRLKAWPVNAKGWVALACIVLTGLAVPAIFALAFGKLAGFVGLPIGMVVAFGATYWVLLNRSRRHRD